MTKIKLINENGVIKGIDPSTGNEVPVEYDDLKTTSLSADDIPGVADFIIKVGEDVKSNVEGAGEGATIAFESHETYDATDVTIPAETRILGNMATWQKAGDGPVATTARESHIENLFIDGQSSTYTGNGIEVRENDAEGVSWKFVKIDDCAGHGLVNDGRMRALYDRCFFTGNGGAGIKETHSASPIDERNRRNDYRRCQVSFNSKAGIWAEGPIDDVRYWIQAQQNNGAAILFDPADTDDYISGVEIMGNIQLNDGPAVLVNGGTVREVVDSATVRSNCADISQLDIALTAPIGQVHFENAQKVENYEVSRGYKYDGGTDASTYISGQSGVIEQIRITGGNGPSNDTHVEGPNIEVEAIGLNGSNWELSKINADEGSASGHTVNGRAWTADLATGDRRFIGRVDVTSLSSPQKGDIATHNGAGDGREGTAYYNGSNWLYHGGIAESANAETPQGTYVPGQTVFFTDTGDGSGNGIYVIDESQTPQGPI